MPSCRRLQSIVYAVSSDNVTAAASVYKQQLQRQAAAAAGRLISASLWWLPIRLLSLSLSVCACEGLRASVEKMTADRQIQMCDKTDRNRQNEMKTDTTKHQVSCTNTFTRRRSTSCISSWHTFNLIHAYNNFVTIRQFVLSCRATGNATNIISIIRCDITRCTPTGDILLLYIPIKRTVFVV